MRVYIGSPIDTAKESPEESFSVLEKLVLRASHNAVIYNPLKAYCNAVKAACPHDYAFISSINDFALKMSDIAVFAWTSSPSFGVPNEIKWCCDNGKPTIVWIREGSAGIYMKRSISFNMGSLSKIVFEEDEVVREIVGFKESLANSEAVED